MFRSHARRDGALPVVKRRPTTNPILPVVNMSEAAEFYRRIGFEVEAYDASYAWVKHGGWEWFHLRLVSSVEGNEASAYLHVDDADAWRAAMVVATSAPEELEPVVGTPWGKREFSFTDPAGNLIRIGSAL